MLQWSSKLHTGQSITAADAVKQKTTYVHLYKANMLKTEILTSSVLWIFLCFSPPKCIILSQVSLFPLSTSHFSSVWFTSLDAFCSLSTSFYLDCYMVTEYWRKDSSLLNHAWETVCAVYRTQWLHSLPSPLTKAQWASSIFALSYGASPWQKLISNRAEL